MYLNVTDIKKSLLDFSRKWEDFEGTERTASQTFLNGLIAAYTGKPDVFEAGARFEEFGSRDEGAGYMDLYWPNKVIFEMKRPSETNHLDRHRSQALEYWRNSANSEKGVSAPPFLVICSFQEFEIWQPGKFPNTPVDRFRLEELPFRFESLSFLSDYEPRFGGDGPAVTKQAVTLMVNLYHDLVAHGTIPDRALRFTTQVIWQLFAEDLGVIEHRPMEQLCKALIADKSQTAATAIYDLFQRLNTADPEERNIGLKHRLPYVNGELFAESSRVHLEKKDLETIVESARFDWTQVNPAIFGTLLEGAMGQERREVLGAHYTSEEDILAVVRPTIVQPWLARLAGVKTKASFMKLYKEFLEFKVLDPAMGSGNFLAIAYREMRQVEVVFRKRITEYAGGQAQNDFGFYPITNLYGIEIDKAAAELAKVTLWMTQAIESHKAGRAHDVLPLDNLSDNISVGDSLFMEWPDVDAIIGNPPYHGDRHLRKVLGNNGLKALTETFNIGTVDYCVYFLRKAFGHLSGESFMGFVLTNSVRSGKNLNAGLRYVTEHGGVIINALSEHEWSGEAAVTVSIVNIQKTSLKPSAILNGLEVPEIAPTLRPELGFGRSATIASNDGKAFVGYYPLGKGWDLSERESRELLEDTSVDYSKVVVGFLTGDDLYAKTNPSPSSYKICFGRMSLEEAEAYPLAMELVRARVKPEREQFKGGHRKILWENWWRWAETRPALESASQVLDKLFGVVIHTTEPIPVWFDRGLKVNHGIIAFPTEDYLMFGFVASSVHRTWAAEKSSSLGKAGRYLRDEVFMHFPFPVANASVENEIRNAAKEFSDLRDQIGLEWDLGPRLIHKKMAEGGFRALSKAKKTLDSAVGRAYGLKSSELEFPDVVLRRLFELNALQSRQAT